MLLNSDASNSDILLGIYIDWAFVDFLVYLVFSFFHVDSKKIFGITKKILGVFVQFFDRADRVDLIHRSEIYFGEPALIIENC